MSEKLKVTKTLYGGGNAREPKHLNCIPRCQLIELLLYLKALSFLCRPFPNFLIRLRSMPVQQSLACALISRTGIRALVPFVHWPHETVPQLALGRLASTSSYLQNLTAND